VSAVDSPDPIVPGNNITYTVTIRNNGPDPAVNGGLNKPQRLADVRQNASSARPASPASASAQFISCTIPSFAVGT
jgi:hypothetical protein